MPHLEEHEKELAKNWAKRLSALADSKRVPNQWGYQPTRDSDLDNRTNHSGAILLVQKTLGLPVGFPSQPSLEAAHIQPGIKVSWTANDRGGLLVRPNTVPSLRLVLVTGPDLDSLRVRGWSSVVDVTRSGMLVTKPNRPDCWVLHQRFLQPLHTLLGE